MRAHRSAVLVLGELIEGAITTEAVRGACSSIGFPALHGERLPSLSLVAVVRISYLGDIEERTGSRLPNARFFSLPDLNHLGASGAAELLVPQVMSFTADL